MIAAMGESLEIAKAWVEACDRGEIQAALALCDRDVELVEAEALPGAVTATGIDAVRRYDRKLLRQEGYDDDAEGLRAAGLTGQPE
jgi:hypothetical protein